MFNYGSPDTKNSEKTLYMGSTFGKINRQIAAMQIN